MQRLRQRFAGLFGRWRTPAFRARQYARNVRDQAARNRNRIARLEAGLGKELKSHDTASSTTRGIVGAIIPLSEIAQGDTSLTREGLQIQPRHLRFKVWAEISAAAASSGVRVIIFEDRENNGTYPTATQLLEADSVVSWPEHDTRPRFRILRDWIIQLGDSGPQQQLREGIIKFGKKKRIWYHGTTAAEGSNGKNALFAYVVSDESTNSPNVGIYTRLRFVD